MTPEKEKMIREFAVIYHDEYHNELLEEIDRLRTLVVQLTIRNDVQFDLICRLQNLQKVVNEQAQKTDT